MKAKTSIYTTWHILVLGMKWILNWVNSILLWLCDSFTQHRATCSKLPSQLIESSMTIMFHLVLLRHTYVSIAPCGTYPSHISWSFSMNLTLFYTTLLEHESRTIIEENMQMRPRHDVFQRGSTMYLRPWGMTTGTLPIKKQLHRYPDDPAGCSLFAAQTSCQVVSWLQQGLPHIYGPLEHLQQLANTNSCPHKIVILGRWNNFIAPAVALFFFWQ